MEGRMRARHRNRFHEKTPVLTLGDAVAAVSSLTSDEREVVAVVLSMLRRHSIRLAGERPQLDSAGGMHR
jgi:hypothetical protein